MNTYTYEPTESDINDATARARAKLPMLGPRLDRAAAILADLPALLTWDDATPAAWSLLSQTHAGVTYTVTPDACTCPDHTRHAASAPGYWCKHRLAYYGYRRILINHLQDRIVGDYALDRSMRYVCRDNRGMILLGRSLTPDIPLGAYWIDGKLPTLICALRPEPNAPEPNRRHFAPATPADFLAFGAWLVYAPAYSLALDRAAFAAMRADQEAAQIAIPTLAPHPVTRLYLATGEIVAPVAAR